jgi:probable HAF family extracellular repeat protein
LGCASGHNLIASQPAAHGTIICRRRQFRRDDHRLTDSTMPSPRAVPRTAPARRPSVPTIARIAFAAALIAAAGCQETVSPDAASPRLSPTGAMRTLTGGSGTIIFVVDPNDIQPPDGDARALNNSGQVTGVAFNLPGNNSGGDGKPYRWTPGSVPVHIGGTLPGTAFGLDINDAGVIAGYTQNGAGGIRAFRAAGTSAVILDTLPGTLQVDGYTRAVAINSSGQIVGEAVPATGFPHAVLWNTSNAIQDLGTLGGSTSSAIDINDAGQVIGTSLLADGTTTHFFLWSAGTGMQDISPLLGSATSILAINNSGQIAGTMATSGGSHAFVYTPGSGVRDLGTLGGTSSSPTGLNNLGQVVGSSTTAGGAAHAFLWTPADGMEDITAKTGFVRVTRLNDNLQTLTGPPQGSYGNGANGPQLVQLTVSASNQAPVAAFTVTCPTLQCTFDGSSSTDDAGIVKYTWSWGNGRSESHSTPVSKNTFASAGTYCVTLTVTDAQGLTGSVTKSVQVPTAAPNQPPVAAIGSYTCSGQQYPHQCSFDASASTDDKGIVSYTWNWGNGRVETKKGPTARNTWASAGTYVVTLTVTDTDGLTGSTQISVNVP